VARTTLTVNTNCKDTVIYYFEPTLADFKQIPIIGIDVHGTLHSSYEFEFYGLDPESMVSEALPVTAKYYHIPNNNFGTTKRKRFTQYGLVIDTKNNPVTFTPIIDCVEQPIEVITTDCKKTVIHQFAADAKGIDMGGILSGANEFEFYGVALDSTASEALPAATTQLHLPPTDLGSPHKKRIRTIPFVIDTLGGDVVYTPKLDCISQPPKTFNTGTCGKRTVFYYFDTDVFVVDIEGDLSGTTPFEFYGMSERFIVETLPIGRVFDQVGPIDFNRQARVYGFRLQAITEGTTLNYTLYNDDGALLTSSIATPTNDALTLDRTYEVNFVKGVRTNVFRMEFKAAAPFYRLKFQLKIDNTGGATDNKWINL
jgi:hypothetical protein